MNIVASLSASFRWLFTRLRKSIGGLYAWFKRRTRRTQIGILFLAGAILVALVIFGGTETKEPAQTPLPAVSLEEVRLLSGSQGGAEVFGTVRSVSEATILSESAGRVVSVRTTLGASVPAGFIIAELENASERAGVLSAEGAYEAAVAARSSFGASTGSSVDNAYRSAFISLETTIENDIDLFFGTQGAYGPRLLISGGNNAFKTLPEMRRELDKKMGAWRKNIESGAPSPEAMLAEAEQTASYASSLLVTLSGVANEKGSGASSLQLAGLASSRASVDALLTSLSSVRNAYEANQTAGSAVSASDAQVKQALGALRLAQANLEKTLVRAPIAGTINYLPIRAGDFVTSFLHVATVAKNGSLEITANMSEDTRALLSVGQTLTVEGEVEAVITSISPALNPETKQVEVRLAASEDANLINGSSVRITVPGLEADEVGGTLMLPLTAVKLLPNSRVVFTVDGESRLSGTEVETGAVRGNAIEILTPLRGDLRIVVDARGRSAGEKVRVVEGSP